MGDKVGKFHLRKTPLDKFPSRKMNGLKIDKQPCQEIGLGEIRSDGEDDGGDGKGKEVCTEVLGEVDGQDDMGAVTKLEEAWVGAKHQKTKQVIFANFNQHFLRADQLVLDIVLHIVLILS